MRTHTLTWSQKYLHYHSDDCSLFLSEDEHKALSHKEVRPLSMLIDNHGNLADYLFSVTNLAEQVRRLRLTDHFKKIGILCDVEQATEYTYMQSNMDMNLLGHSGFNLKVVRDLLHEMSAGIIELRQPSVIVKPCGAAPSIGPVLNLHKNSPCAFCLHTRLIGNNPAREWHRRQLNLDVVAPVPTLHQGKSLENIYLQFSQHLARLAVEPELQNAIFQLNSDVTGGQYHYVAKLPQCPVCGDPNLITQTFIAPIQIEDFTPHADHDGGYRREDREVTLAKLQAIISPICGVISDIKELSKSGQDQLAIYQASYTQNTYSCAAPTVDTFTQLSLGKGVSKVQAQISALGEALERKAAQYTGEEPIIRALPAELDGRYYVPQRLAPFSDAQYQIFEKLGVPSLNEPQVVKRYSGETPLHWCPAWSLTTNERVYLPAAFCLANTPFSDQAYSVYTHNGNSAGNSLEEAILQGILELIERDAAAIWWYNQIPRPAISLDIIPYRQRQTIANSLAPEWDYWLLDISQDLPVVTCTAVGKHRKTEKLVLGFGCHLSPEIAAQRALTEMYQLICVKDQVSGPFDFDAIESHPYLYPRNNTPLKVADNFKASQFTSIKCAILYLLEALRSKNMDLCVVNYSRPDLPLKTVKVVVPGLCHFWPQLANKRLYESPVALGWLTYQLTEGELNTQALYL